MFDTFFKIAYALFIVCVVMLGLLLLVTTVPHAQLSVKIVQSGSMEPSIKTGSMVVIHKESTYKAGDVITFLFSANDKVPTSHRITQVRSEGAATFYTTKGDANKNIDPRETQKENIIGKVVFSLPYIGYILDFAKKPLGFALIIGLPAVFIIFDEVSKIYSEVKMQAAKKEDEQTQTDDHV